MAKVRFTSNLKRFYPTLGEMTIEKSTVSELLDSVENAHPGLKDYIIDETGALRKHVNIFIGNDMVADREKLSDQLSQNDEVYIMQALSGG